MHARGFMSISSGITREKYDGGGFNSSYGYASGRWSTPTHLTSSPGPVQSSVSRSRSDGKTNNHYGWTELEITGKIVNISPVLWQFNQLTALYLRNNSLTILPPEIAHLANLIVLDLTSNKLHTLPSEVGELVRLKDLLLGNNCLSHLPLELGKLFQLTKLELKGNPLPSNVLSILNETNGIQKLLSSLLDQISVPSVDLPPLRPWIPINNPDTQHNVAAFTVMCYNILCDKYCTRQLYGYCPQWALNWDYRKKIILDEIRHYDADIVSLQEVETEQFQTYFQPELKKDGYVGVFSAKSRARTMAEADRKHVDGCAIFYKSSKFRAVQDHLIEFNQLAIEAADGSHDMINRVMTKDNIGLALLLETTDTLWPKGVPGDGAQTGKKPLVLVATCHVHWDPEFCDVKLIQTMMLIHRLQNIIKDYLPATATIPPVSGTSATPSPPADCNQIPIVLCGDLNSLPDSGVVEYLQSGRINSSHKDFKEIGYDCLCKLSFSTDVKDTYTHPFRLSQAYRPELLPFTNYTYDFKGIIDYIFYGRDTMRPLCVLGPVDSAWFDDNRVLGCPHPQIPSDHLPLLVQFELNPTLAHASSGSPVMSSNRSPTHRRR